MSIRRYDGQAKLWSEDAPWERALKGENARQYAAFCHFRDLGPRRTVEAAWRESILASDPELNREKLNRKAPTHWNEWCRENNWRDRAEAWDAHREKQKREVEDERQRELEELRRSFELAQHHRLAGIVDKLETLLEDKLLKLPPTDIQQVREDGSVIKAKGLPPAQIARLLDSIRETAGQVIHGHYRKSLTGKIEPEGGSGDPSDGAVYPVDMEFRPENDQ